MPKTVLIAEDVEDARSMTRIMLESFGYDVLEAKDGYEAIEEAKAHIPDLILMDVAMPEMNGITAATLIRSVEHCEQVPIIALTAYSKEYVDAEEDYGFEDVMQKPVHPDDLKDLLDHYLDKKADN